MKKDYKIAICYICLIVICLLMFAFSNDMINSLFKKNPLEDNLYVNFLGNKNSNSYRKAHKLVKHLRQKGVKTYFNTKDNSKTGNINLYIANTDLDTDIGLDSNAINILWIPYISPNEDYSLFRKFDVVIVKSIPSYSHLKAINVRTAYIPDAFDVKLNNYKYKKDSAYWGDNTRQSLALNLAKDKKIDIFGKKWHRTIYHRKVVKNDNVKLSDFKDYAIVLVDQDDRDDIAKELVNDNIIELISAGFVPFIRYNEGIKAIFKNTVPMYYNPEDFHNKYENLINNKNKILNIRENIYNIAKKWDSSSQADKFIEIFSIMQKKRIK